MGLSTQRLLTLASILLLPYGVSLRPAFAQPARPAGSAAPTPPPAAPPAPKTLGETLTGQAKLEYEAARVLHADGDFATAGQKYRAAYGQQSDIRLLWNIAACEKNLRHYTKAVVLIRKYLSEGGSLLTNDDRQEATYALNVIERLTAPITLKVNEPGATVSIDEEIIGESPLPDPITVDVGQRKIRVMKVGFRPAVIEQAISPSMVIDVKLEQERGRLELQVPGDATVFLDDKEIGHGPLVMGDHLPVGPHTLKVTAPRKRTYQGELVLEDDKPRKLTVNLEQDPDLVSELRIAVGCADERVRTPDEGLIVFVDDSSESVSTLGVRKRVLEDGREVPAFVPITVNVGQHRIRVHFPGCDPLEVPINAAPNKAVTIEGILPPSNPFFSSSPAGSPNGWEVHAGLSTTHIEIPKFQRLFANPTIEDVPASVTLAGIAAGGGLHVRWFQLAGEMRYIVGSTSGSRMGVNTSITTGTNVGPISQAASLSMFDVGMRLGPRIPLYFAAIGFGVGGTVGAFMSSPDTAKGSMGEDLTSVFGRGFGWASIEATPLCDFAVHGGFSYGVMGIDSDADDKPLADLGIFLHVAYQPNDSCSRQRDGRYRIAEQRR